MKTILFLSIILFTLCGLKLNVYAQIVSIPDANFKAALVGNSSINTNGDVEIQTSEASAFSGSLNVGIKNITDLTGIESFTALTALYCYDNQLTSLDVSANTALTDLRCYDNQITSLDVSANTALTFLWCSSNQLTSLDVASNTVLLSLYCSYNQLTSLNVSANTALYDLYCGNNQLTSLDVLANTTLTFFDFRDNQLTSLNVSANTALVGLICNNNQLTSLNVSANSELNSLFCRYNQLTSLNLRNGNNTNLIYFAANDNPSLSCINVDNATWSTANWTNIDAGASFSEDCYTDISELNNTTEIITYPNPVINEVTVEISNPKSLILNPKFEIMNIHGQVIEKIDISSEKTSIDISNFSSGVYTIKIITDNGIIIKKIIK